MPIDDSPQQEKKTYTSDPLPASNSVASKNSVINLIITSDSPLIHFPYSGDTGMDHIIMRDKYDCENPKRGYFARHHDETKISKKKVILIHGFYQ